MSEEINSRDEQGFTALNSAILEGKFREAARLLRLGADPNILDGQVPEDKYPDNFSVIDRPFI